MDYQTYLKVKKIKNNLSSARSELNSLINMLSSDLIVNNGYIESENVVKLSSRISQMLKSVNNNIIPMYTEDN